MHNNGLVRDHPRSLAMSPCEIGYTTSYTDLYYAFILYSFRDIASYVSKFADYRTPLLLGAPVGDDPIRISARSLASEN